MATGQPLYQYLIQQFQLTDHAAIPTCLYGLVNGGQYGSDNLDIQEFLVIPASHLDYRVSLEMESALRTKLQEMLKNQKANYSFGELGGFTPALQKNTDVFEFIVEAARKTNYILSRDFFFGIDTGGDNLVSGGKYLLKDKSTGYSEKELLEYYKNLREKYNLTYFEDPFAVKDAGAWQAITTDLADAARIAGDVITATQPSLVQHAIENRLCNTLVVKPSQVGTVTETLQAIKLARNAGWAIVISQRTGETNDDFLADFAVGVGAEFVKFGPTNRGEAVAKYNRLADIYQALEQTHQEGTAMTEPTQPTNTSTPAVPPPDEPTVDQTTEPTSVLGTPPAPPAPAADPSPTDLPQNTSIPVVEPPQPPTSTPAKPPVVSATPMPPKPPAGPAVTPPATPPPNIPPPSQPPTPPAPPTTPLAAAGPTEKPSEADVQQSIDKTLSEIGAKPPAVPGGETTAPPSAPAKPASPTASEPTPQE